MSMLIKPMDAARESTEKSFNFKTIPGIASASEKGAKRMMKGKSFPCVRGGGYVSPLKCLTNFVKKNDNCSRDNGCSTGNLMLKAEYMGVGFCSDVHCRGVENREKNLYGKHKLCLKCFIGELEHMASEPNEPIKDEQKVEQVCNTLREGVKVGKDGYGVIQEGQTHVMVNNLRFSRGAPFNGASEVTLTKLGSIVLSAGFVKNEHLERFGFAEVMVSDNKEAVCIFFLTSPTEYSRVVSFNKDKKTLPKISCRLTLEAIKDSLGHRYKVERKEADNIFILYLSEPLSLKR